MVCLKICSNLYAVDLTCCQNKLFDRYHTMSIANVCKFYNDLIRFGNVAFKKPPLQTLILSLIPSVKIFRAFVENRNHSNKVRYFISKV